MGTTGIASLSLVVSAGGGLVFSSPGGPEVGCHDRELSAVPPGREFQKRLQRDSSSFSRDREYTIVALGVRQPTDVRPSLLTQTPPGKDFADVTGSVLIANIKERIELNIPGSNDIGIHAEPTPGRPNIGAIDISVQSGDALLWR